MPRPVTYKTDAERQAAWMASYQRSKQRHHERYHTDPEFRAELQAKARAHYHAKRDTYAAYAKIHGPVQRERRRRILAEARAQERQAADADLAVLVAANPVSV